MKPGIAIAALLGAAAIVYLVFHVGFSGVLNAALTVGWSGFAILIAYALGLFVILGFAWWVLIPGAKPAQLATFIWSRVIRDSASEVLPFSQVGGFVIGARAASLHGVPAPISFGSTVVDITTEMMAQIAYVLIGVALLVIHAPHSSLTKSLFPALFAGLALALTGAIAFVVVQRRGFDIAGRLASRFLPKAVGHAEAIDQSVNAIYSSPIRLALGAFCHFVGWVASAVGTFIAFRLMGTKIELASAIAIESLVYGMRSAAFFVPNALGVQEAAYAVLTPLFGIGPEVGIALSLIRRARDITIGIPVLLIWQALESHRLIAKPANKTTQLQEK